MGAQNRNRRWTGLDDSFMADGLCRAEPFRDAMGRVEGDDRFDPTSRSSIWFREDRTNAAARMQTNEAKAICRTCPVEDACLAYALAAGIEDGVWGGLTGRERLAILRSRRALVATG